LEDETPLLARARRGDREAFWELVEPNLLRVRRLLVRMTGSREEAEDLCQESVLKAMRAVRDFRGGSRFSTWFYRIALNAALSAKSARRDVAVDSGKLDLLPPDAGRADLRSSYATVPPSASVEAHESHSALRTALQSLPPRQRAVVLLRIEEELPFAEVAERLDLTVGAVKAHFWQATQKLRAVMAPSVASEG